MTFGAPPSAPTMLTARAWRELAVVALAMAGYFGLRLVVEGEDGVAVHNADRLLDVERRLGLDFEHAVQAWTLERDVVRWLLSAGYVWLHWPLLIAAMVFLAFRAPDVLARLRNAMIVSGAVGVLLFATIPMAPPRFMPGFVGTVSDAARRHYLPYSLDWTNEFAAFPSYHVGWTLIACLAVAGVIPHRGLRWLVLLPAAVVALAVVGTGNHYVLDSGAGAGFALLAWWATRPRSCTERDDGAGAVAVVDANESAVGGQQRRRGGGHDARPTELARDDDRVARLAADVDDDDASTGTNSGVHDRSVSGTSSTSPGPMPPGSPESVTTRARPSATPVQPPTPARPSPGQLRGGRPFAERPGVGRGDLVVERERKDGPRPLDADATSPGGRVAER